MGKVKYNWTAIKNEYVTSLEAIPKNELAKKYGFAYPPFVTKAKLEGWDVERERFISRLAEQRIEKKAEAVASEGAKADARCLDYALKVLTHMEETMVEMEKKVKVEGRPLILSPRSAAEHAKALLSIQAAINGALGDVPVQKVEFRQGIEIEEVLKKYANAGSSGVSDTNHPK